MPREVECRHLEYKVAVSFLLVFSTAPMHIVCKQYYKRMFIEPLDKWPITESKGINQIFGQIVDSL